MIRGSADLERAVIRRVRKEIKASKELKADYRRHRSSRSSAFDLSWLLFIFIPICVPSVARSPEQMFFAVTLLVWAGVFHRSCRLTAWPTQDLLVLGHLPIEDGGIARHHWDRQRRATLFTAFAFVPLAAACAFRFGIPMELALAMGVAGLAIAACSYPGAAVLLAAWPSGWRLLVAILLLVSATVVSLRERAIPAAATPALLAVSAVSLVLLLLAPLASSRAWRTIAARRPEYMLLLPASTAEAEVQSSVDNDLINAGVDPESLEDARGRALGLVAPAEEARIRSGHSLVPLQWSTLPPIERLCGRLLSPRERTVAEYLLGPSIGWTTAAVWAGVLALAAISAALAFEAQWLHLLAFVFAAMCAPTLVGGSWPGLGSAAGASLRRATSLPIAGWEIARVVLKTNVVRSLFFAPFLAAYFHVIARSPMHRESMPWLGLKVVFIAFALQPAIAAIRLLFRLDENTGSTRVTLSIANLGKTVVGFVATGIAIASIALLVFSNSLAQAAIPASVLVLLSLALYGLCVKAYDRGWVD